MFVCRHVCMCSNMWRQNYIGSNWIFSFSFHFLHQMKSNLLFHELKIYIYWGMYVCVCKGKGLHSLPLVYWYLQNNPNLEDLSIQVQFDGEKVRGVNSDRVWYGKCECKFKSYKTSAIWINNLSSYDYKLFFFFWYVTLKKVRKIKIIILKEYVTPTSYRFCDLRGDIRQYAIVMYRPKFTRIWLKILM